jgi:hypothetical protein
VSRATEDLLRDGLAGIGERISVPAGLGLRAHERWRRGRRARRFRGALLGGAAMATAGVLALTLTGGAPAGGTPAGGFQSSAYVSKVKAAMLAADTAGLVEYVTTELPPGQGPGLMVASPSYAPGWNNPRYTQPVLEQWSDRKLFATRFYGKPGDEIFAGMSTTTQKGFVTTFVTYSGQTWWREAVMQGPSPSDGPVFCGGSPDEWATNWQAQVRGLLACKNVVVDNTPGRIGGQAAVELSAWVPHAATWHLWVNPASYLPLQYDETGPGVPLIITTFHWQRPTRANLAPFQLTVPRGYRRVPFPVG